MKQIIGCNISRLILLSISILTLNICRAQTNVSLIESYTEKCNKYWSSNLDSAEYFGLKAVELAKKEKEKSEVVSKAYMILAVVYYYTGEYDTAIKNINNGLEIAESIQSEWGQGFGYNLLTILMRKKGDFYSSIEYAEKTIEFRKAQKDTFNLAGAYNNLATTYSNMGNMELALENQLISLELKINTNDTIGMCMGHGNIADIYLTLDKVELAKEHIDKGISISKKGTEMYANNLLILGDILHTNYNQPDTAFLLYTEALKTFSNIGIMDGVGVAHENIASTLITMDKLDSALVHLHKAETIFEQIGDFAQIAHVNLNYGEYHFKLKDFAKAIFYTKKALKYARQSGNSTTTLNALNALYTLNKNYNKSNEALSYFEQFKAYSDSLNTKEAYSNMATLETRYKTLEKENKIIRLEYEKSQDAKHKQFLYGTITFIILLIIVAGIGIIIRNKKQKEINRQKQQLLIDNKKLVELELESSKIKEEELQQSIIYKTKQLSSHALHMMQKNNLMTELDEVLRTIKVKDDSKDQLRKTKLLLNKSLRSDKDWDVFKKYFEEVNENFYSKLQEINNGLTNVDLKICSLIKLNMDSKEMASVLNVVPNSIKSSRYRLKKKLGLNPDTDLEDFIRALK